jgi:cell cycle sensor histidine kinase DivJ
VHDRQDDVREVVAVLRDVTQRKAQEIALDAARREADRANAAKTRFLATMSHELRTPLNAIIGFSEMLVSEDAMRIDAKRRVEYAQLINDSGQHLLSVVNGILDMSKIENGNFEITPEPFAPGEVVDVCCELLALKAREGGIDLLAKVDKGLPEVVADKRAMIQIMLNLMSNALKFTPPGGKVTIGARTEGPHLVYSVNDTGVGISAEDLPRLGEPFFQARGTYDRRHDGTGLGLSIVKGLLTLHGGDLQIRSRPGEGTRISVKLPLDCESARRAQAAAAVVDVAPAKPVIVTAKIFQSNQLQVKKSA